MKTTLKRFSRESDGKTDVEKNAGDSRDFLRRKIITDRKIAIYNFRKNNLCTESAISLYT